MRTNSCVPSITLPPNTASQTAAPAPRQRGEMRGSSRTGTENTKKFIQKAKCPRNAYPPPFKYPCYFGTDIPDQKLLVATGRTVEQINEVIGADTLGYLSTEHVVQLTKNAKCGFCTACFTGEYAVKPDEVLSTDIHERHLDDRPKDEKKLGE